MRKSTIHKLQELHACSEAIAWAKTYPNLQAAWDACERCDWMIWLINSLSGDKCGRKRKDLVLLLCKGTAGMLPYIGKNKKKLVRGNLRAIRQWARSDAICLQPLFTTSNRIYDKLNSDHRKIIQQRMLKLIRKDYPKPPRLRKCER